MTSSIMRTMTLVRFTATSAVLLAGIAFASRTYACDLTFDVGSPYGLGALSAGCADVPFDNGTKYAADSVTCYPFYRQQCETPFGVVSTLPQVYEHYHLGYEDPVDCFGQSGGTLNWEGLMSGSTCHIYNPVTEKRYLSGHDELESIIVFPSNSDFAKPRVSINVVSPDTGEVCLHADVVPSGYSTGWYCWTSLYTATWTWSGFTGWRFDEISLGTTAGGPGGAATFDHMIFTQI
jgi:hypothetical protein